MKYLGVKKLPDPRGSARLISFDLFEFDCRWCEERGSIVGAPTGHKEWPFQCGTCGRKYTHWRPEAGMPGVPDLVPMIDLYERSGRDKPVPRLDFPGYVPPGRANPRFGRE